MARKKEEAITLTHLELLNYAIKTISDQYLKEKERNETLRQVDPKYIDETWKQKLLIALNMYKIETGRDYGYEYDIE